MRRLAWIACAALWFGGCQYDPEAATTALPEAVAPVPQDTAPEPEPEPEPLVPSPVEIGDEVPVSVTPPPDPPALPTRPRRRMDIDQLNAAIRHVTGGIGWTQTVGGREVDQFEALATTLGRPDFIETTQEDLSPSALFAKFLDEAARTVCARVAETEARGERDENTLLITVGPRDRPPVADAAIDRNIAALLRRFHSRVLAPGDPGLVHWRWAFDAALHISDDPVVAWRTVCTGLILHPDFTTY